MGSKVKAEITDASVGSVDDSPHHSEENLKFERHLIRKVSLFMQLLFFNSYFSVSADGLARLPM
jgi:hypothetical protein